MLSTPSTSTPPTCANAGAHYLLTIKNNQRGQARQLHRLPWKDVPVIHRDDARGHGRHEQRLMQVVTVDGLLFPHARQVLRSQRRRRLCGAKKWSSETIYAITEPAPPSRRPPPRSPPGSAGSQVRTRNTPAVLAALRDLIRGAFKLAGYVNTAAGRRARGGFTSIPEIAHDSLDVRVTSVGSMAPVAES